MTANIKEILDGGADPNTPSVAEMRESQRMGSVGKGTFCLSVASTVNKRHFCTNYPPTPSGDESFQLPRNGIGYVYCRTEMEPNSHSRSQDGDQQSEGKTNRSGENSRTRGHDNWGFRGVQETAP